MSLLGALIVSAVATIGLTARTTWPRLVVEEFPSPARRLLAYAALTLTLALTVVLPGTRFGKPVPAERLAHVDFPSLFLGHALLLGFLVLWWLLAGRRPLLRFLHVRTERPLRAIRYGVAAGFAGWAVTMLAMAVTGTLVGLLGGSAVGDDAEIPGVVRTIVGLSAPQRLALVVSAGVFEELFFRSFLQARTGLLLSTVLFTASHASYGLPLMLVGVFAVSLVLGRVFRERGDVVPCMVAHAVFDAIQLFVVLPVVVEAA
ncbi:MAG: CPBP family intramembrane glutamic endopeptidase [Thermodesulfobacteriota bacterium]